jgi:dynein heavy chain
MPIDSDSGTPGAPACYMEVTNPRRLTETLETFLEEYNAESKKPMDLVLFMFATEHVTRIARIMSMPSGNALLVGMGGSGRQVRVQYFPSFYLLLQQQQKILD